MNQLVEKICDYDQNIIKSIQIILPCCGCSCCFEHLIPELMTCCYYEHFILELENFTCKECKILSLGSKYVDCLFCKGKKINLKECLLMLKNKNSIQEKLFNLKKDELNKKIENFESINLDKNFQISESYDEIIRKIDFRREEMKLEFEKMIDDYYNQLLDTIKADREKNQKLLIENIKLVNLDGIKQTVNKIDYEIINKTNISNRSSLILKKIKDIKNICSEFIAIDTILDQPRQHDLFRVKEDLDIEKLFGKLIINDISLDHLSKNNSKLSNPNPITQEMIDVLLHGDSLDQLNVTKNVRKFLSDKSPPIEEVINAGIVPIFVEFLERDDYELQYESILVLTNIAYGSEFQTKCVIEAGALSSFLKLLTSTNESIREEVAWALGNIAASSPKYRDLVINQGVLGLLLQILKSRTSIKRNVVWCVSNLCRGKNPPVDFSKIEPILPVLANLLYNSDSEILESTCWAISYLSDGPKDKIQKIIDSGVCYRLVELLTHNSLNVIQASLRAIGNIVSGNDSQTRVILNRGVLKYLNPLLDSTRDSIKKDACWTISNITAGNQQQIQLVKDANIFPKLAEIISKENNEARQEAIWAILNALSSASNEQIKYFVDLNFISILCDLLFSEDSQIVLLALKGLLNLLDSAKEDMETYTEKIREYGSLEKIELLKDDRNQKISEKAIEITEIYFKKKN